LLFWPYEILSGKGVEIVRPYPVVIQM